MAEDSRRIPGRLDFLNSIIKELTSEDTLVVVDK
jgi:hypothetical protein